MNGGGGKEGKKRGRELKKNSLPLLRFLMREFVSFFFPSCYAKEYLDSTIGYNRGLNDDRGIEGRVCVGVSSESGSIFSLKSDVAGILSRGNPRKKSRYSLSLFLCDGDDDALYRFLEKLKLFFPARTPPPRFWWTLLGASAQRTAGLGQRKEGGREKRKETKGRGRSRSQLCIG